MKSLKQQKGNLNVGGCGLWQLIDHNGIDWTPDSAGNTES